MDLRVLQENYKAFEELYPTNTTRKNYFLAACKLFDCNCDFEDVNELTPYGGLIGCDDSRLENYLNFSKIFRLHAVLHDAAGFMFEYNQSGPGYCYVLNLRRLNWCVIGHFTGLLYCLYKKLFSQSYYSLLAV